MYLKTLSTFFAIAFAILLPAPASAENEFQLEYRDGTILTTKFTEKVLLWTDVSELGQMSTKPIAVSDIKSLMLTTEPASKQLSDILKLIADLDSDDFFVREEAEAYLRKNGRRFRSLIERNNTLKTPDGIYRLNRILSALKLGKKNQSTFALDVLILKNGAKLNGDAGTGNFDFLFDGEPISVTRKQLSRITRANKELETRPSESTPVVTKLFHNHARFMKNRDVRLVDFELKPDGTPLRSTDKNIMDVFVDFGLQLGTEFPMGCVGISGYPIKGGEKPVGGNSICVFQSKTRTVKRFQGVMEITFCQPGKKNISHGVRDLGLFLSRVNHSRDLIVEAYDSTGRILGVCESNDEPCTFCGISSSVPIAKVRVLSNPWLLELRKFRTPDDRFSQKVDRDYAVDSIMFSRPVPVDSIRKDRHFYGRNGDVIPANWVRVLDNEKVELGSRNIKNLAVSLPNSNTIGLKPEPKTMQKRPSGWKWMAMLRDNSVIQWSSTKQGEALFASRTLGEKIPREDVIAIWPAATAPRLPLANDFEVGKNVLVYPGCRVTTPKVELDEKGYRWTNGTVRTENLHEIDDQKVDQRDDDQPDDVSPSKANYSLDVTELKAFEIPTIWFQQPKPVLANQGMIKLDGNEIIVFGEGALFQFVSVAKDRITLKWQAKELSIPISKVISIVPPQN